MSLFRSALNLCGLSQREAAEYLDVSVSSVEKWSRGVVEPPAGVWAELSALWQVIWSGGTDELPDGARANADALEKLRGG